MSQDIIIYTLEIFTFILIVQLIQYALNRETAGVNKQQPVNSRIALTVQEFNGMYYLYDRQTDEFICQGRRITELARNCLDRFPGYAQADVVGPQELAAQIQRELQRIGQH